MKKTPKTKTTKTAKTKTKPSPETRRFATAASYTGECCKTPHVWLALIRAVDAPTAEAVLRKRVTAKQLDCHDVIALPFSPKTKVPTAGPSGHRAVVVPPTTKTAAVVPATKTKTKTGIDALMAPVFQ